MRRSQQEGSIVRVRGWWVVRYREKVAVNGVLKRINRARRLTQVGQHCKTKAAARELAKNLLAAINDRAASPTRNVTLSEFVENVYLPHVKNYQRPSTYSGYRKMWFQYFEPRCRDEWMRDTKTCDVQLLLERIAREHSISKTTLSHAKHFLSGVFRFAAQQDYLDAGRANPVKSAKIPAFAREGVEGEAYSLEEMNAMLRVLNDRCATVITVAAMTGLRKGELQGLTWEVYSPAEDEESLGSISVVRSIWCGQITDPKTTRSKAPVPVTSQCAERLEAWRKACGSPTSGPIFQNSRGKPLDLDGLYRREMKDVLKLAGIAWKGYHGFRRGLASNLNRLGLDDSVIQAILRHSSVAITQAAYIKTSRPDTVEAMRLLSKKMTASGICSSSALQ